MRLHAVVAAGECERRDIDAIEDCSSHHYAHLGEYAVRPRWYDLQPLCDQRRRAVEVRLEVNELLFAAAVVGLEAAEARPFRTGVIVAVSVEGGSHTK